MEEHFSKTWLQQPNFPIIIVDGTFKENIRAVGKVILMNKELVIYWNIMFGTCPSSEYVEARTVIEALLKLRWTTTPAIMLVIYIFQNIITKFSWQHIIKADWSLILKGCFVLLYNLHVSFPKISSRKNSIAHKLAKKTLKQKFGKKICPLDFVSFNEYILLISKGNT